MLSSRVEVILDCCSSLDSRTLDGAGAEAVRRSALSEEICSSIFSNREIISRGSTEAWACVSSIIELLKNYQSVISIPRHPPSTTVLVTSTKRERLTLHQDQVHCLNLALHSEILALVLQQPAYDIARNGLVRHSLNMATAHRSGLCDDGKGNRLESRELSACF